MMRQPLLEQYPLETWEVQWSASYGGPGALKCILVHPNVAGHLLGDIRDYLDQPGIKESILKYGTTYGETDTTKDARHILMTAEAMKPIRILLDLEESGVETELVQAHISSDLAQQFKVKCRKAGLTQRQVVESLLADWVD